VKPPPFEYVAPTSVAEALEALASDEDARVLAGGQSLVPMMNLRLARPTVLVDCNRIDELTTFAANGSSVRLGAFCRHRRLELDVEIADAAPLLAEAAALVGYPQIRNRATLGGSLSHADPASELSAACLVLGASVNVRGPGGERSIPVADLFEGFFSTTLRPGELLVSVDVPSRTPRTGYAFREFAPRHGDFALAGVGVAISRDANDRVGTVRMAGCGIGSTVVDLSEAGTELIGSTLSDDALRATARQITNLVQPPDDVHGSAAYRVELAQLVAVDALRAAWTGTERT
jgi:aerobic carbon-monoxide dehydrogenase medium subunit